MSRSPGPLPTIRPEGSLSRAELLGRLLILLALLFGFLVSIETMSKAIKTLASAGFLGGGDSDELFRGVSNPFAGLALGVLFTVVVQSSSTTTSTLVAVVGSGALTVEHAVPMVLGANIGTTITNTLVSIGHMRRSLEFRRAFAAATVHDFFNLSMVVIFLPLEIFTGALSKSAYWLTDLLAGGSGAEYKSPIKTSIKAVHEQIVGAVETFGLEGTALGATCLVVGIALTLGCLYLITRNMRLVIAGQIERGMNRILESSGIVPLLVGIGITVSVQSSSITTSLLVPMCAAGVLSLKKAFPVMLGANIGTTVTALLASLAQDNDAALTIALVHVLFNCGGVAMVYPFAVVREIPQRMARQLALRSSRNPVMGLFYVLVVFVLIPLSGWLLWSAGP